MKKLNLAFFVLIISLFFACRNETTNKKDKSKTLIYHIDTTVTFNCFCDSLKMPDGKLVVCEPSAIAFYNDSIFLANDKPMPNTSAVSKAKFNKLLDAENMEYLEDLPLTKGFKYEDFAVSPDAKFVFLTTSFSWFDEEHAAYNNLYYWQTGNKRTPHLFTENNDSSLTSSKHLHKLFANVIDTVNYKDGVPYLKIEGMAVIPGDTLLFGIREYGKAYEDFDYCMKIVAVPYTVENNKINLIEKSELIFDYNPKNFKDCEINKNIGISSMEYNKYDKKLYILTSYENGDKTEDVGAYLWTISLPELRKNKQPSLVYESEKSPIHFAHKAEGITFVDDKTLLIIHDDDRRYGPEKITDPDNQFKRKHNQAAYSVLRKK